MSWKYCEKGKWNKNNKIKNKKQIKTHKHIYRPKLQKKNQEQKPDPKNKIGVKYT